MKLSKEGRKLAKDMLRAGITNGVLDADRLRQAADSVIRARPRNTLGVLKEFSRLVRLELSKRHATIESAAELEGAEKASITRTIRAKYGADVTTEYKVSPALIGGLKIQVGSDVVDASVRSRLDRLANDLAA